MDLHIGERIRQLRIEKALSLRALASSTGFSPGFVSQVENGQTSPSIASLERIAHELGITLADFFSDPLTNGTRVIRAADRQKLTSFWSKAEIEVLGGTTSPHNVEVVMITIEAGGRSGKVPSSHRGEEFALVFKGEVTLTLGEKTYDLLQGDAVSFTSETPHLWENKCMDAAQIVIVSPRFTH